MVAQAAACKRESGVLMSPPGQLLAWKPEHDHAAAVATAAALAFGTAAAPTSSASAWAAGPGSLSLDLTYLSNLRLMIESIKKSDVPKYL